MQDQEHLFISSVNLFHLHTDRKIIWICQWNHIEIVYFFSFRSAFSIFSFINIISIKFTPNETPQH